MECWNIGMLGLEDWGNGVLRCWGVWVLGEWGNGEEHLIADEGM
jgi:hypothetical protein